MAVAVANETPEQIARNASNGQRHRHGKWLRIGAGVLLAGALGLGLIYADVRTHGGPILTNRQEVPNLPVAIVFGAGYTRQGLSPILQDRVVTGVSLYKTGKVRKLLMTGDNGLVSHNEPEAMCQAAMQMGVPRRDIVLDYAGFRTYDSLYRARDVFGIRQALLVTQAYHLPRACYTARSLGLDVVGVPADRRDYGAVMPRYLLREFLAIENAWIEAHISHPRPTFLGRKEPLFGGQDSGKFIY